MPQKTGKVRALAENFYFVHTVKKKDTERFIDTAVMNSATIPETDKNITLNILTFFVRRERKRVKKQNRAEQNPSATNLVLFSYERMFRDIKNVFVTIEHNDKISQRRINQLTKNCPGLELYTLMYREEREEYIRHLINFFTENEHFLARAGADTLRQFLTRKQVSHILDFKFDLPDAIRLLKDFREIDMPKIRQEKDGNTVTTDERRLEEARKDFAEDAEDAAKADTDGNHKEDNEEPMADERTLFRSLTNEEMNLLLQKDPLMDDISKKKLLARVRSRLVSGNKPAESAREQKPSKRTINVPEELLPDLKDFLMRWSPKKIVEYLDRYIANQEDAKWELAFLCYEHVSRLKNRDASVKKTNCVMYGPTGCGKTELTRRIREIMPVPVEILDAGSITATGWSGPDKEELLYELKTSDPNIEYGIVILDEFDKACTPSHSAHGDDVSAKNQANLLKMIEGTKLFLNKRQRYSQSDKKKEESGFLDTTHISFICAGAFIGAFDKEKKQSIGFGAHDETVAENTQAYITENLIEFGVIPEMAGRIGLGRAIPLNELTEDDIYEIATQKQDTAYVSALKQIEQTYDIKIIIEEDAMREICHIVHEQKLGARPLQGVLQFLCHEVVKMSLKYGIKIPVNIMTCRKEYHMDKETALKLLRGMMPEQEEILRSVTDTGNSGIPSDGQEENPQENQ